MSNSESILEFIQSRNIQELLHFTTNKGITGMLSTGSILSRYRLKIEKYIDYIRKYNCVDRSRDVLWHDYVNLSISVTNQRLFRIAKNYWHVNEDGWWCILSIDPEICTHENVIFTTTIKGLSQIFDNSIVRWSGNTVQRTKNCSQKIPTCFQAEILYPQKVSLEYLKNIYVPNSEIADKLAGIISVFNEWQELTDKIIIHKPFFI